MSADRLRAEGTAPRDPQLKRMLAAETGGRGALGAAAVILMAVPLCWSLFQLWIASPLPFTLNVGILNEQQSRIIHLAFALFLAFAAFPMLKSAHGRPIPWYDWLLAVLAVSCTLYLLVFNEALAGRAGAPKQMDILVSALGLLLLLEATRRTLGLPLTIVALVFLGYTFGGPYMPEVISHKGASLQKVMSHQWLSTEGVFGVALGVSTSFVFLFVLFGALLERAGAGHYFIQVAYAFLGHLRGGPAKAAVVSSGLSGMISGSSIANVVTTGTFTIPLMKRVGFPAVKAGAVEVAASTNGQLTPPIMGAAAFLMVEYVGISYLEVIKHAFLPALISYVALLYIVHLEALKLGMEGVARRRHATLIQRLLLWLTVFLGLAVLTFAVYYGMGWIKQWLGDQAIYGAGLLLILAYVLLLAYATRYPPLVEDDPDQELQQLPDPGPTLKAGLHYLLPVVVMIWCLAVERLSPALSAFWATLFMIFIVVTQRPIMALLRRQGNWLVAAREGGWDCVMALISGARNMVGIGIATATAGIVVGTVTLTGIGLVMTEFVELISGGNLLAMLIFTALISLVLGMGLPTTANYIVVSTLMAPVIVTLGAEHGLVVPLIAVHMFVFYFGILADDTPPVGLAAYAAAAISGADPIRTGVQGFAYDIRTAILPFMFIFNTQLLLIGVEQWWELVLVIASATLAMLLFAAATQGYWLVRTRWWESLALVLIAFTLFRPGFWWHQWYPPVEPVAPTEIHRVLDALTPGDPLRMQVAGETLMGDQVNKTVELRVPDAPDAESKLAEIGLELRTEDERVLVDHLIFGSPAEAAGIDFDWEILHVEQATDYPRKEWMFVPALLLLAGLFLNQRRRQGRVALSSAG